MTKRNANILCATVVAVSVMFIVVLVLCEKVSFVRGEPVK
jgi:hypothetical protein